MKKFIASASILSLLFIGSGCIQKQQEPIEDPYKITEQDLVGSWKSVEGCEFENISFSIENGERIFSLSFDDEPSISGQWQLADESLTITASDGFHIRYEYAGVTGDDLLLIEDNHQERYKKMK